MLNTCATFIQLNPNSGCWEGMQKLPRHEFSASYRSLPASRIQWDMIRDMCVQIQYKQHAMLKVIGAHLHPDHSCSH